MSRETVVWTTSKPGSCSASASSAWVEMLTLADEPEDRSLTLAPAHRSTSARIPSACSTSPRRRSSGGVSRRTVSPAEPTRRPCREACGHDRAGGPVELRADQEAGAAHGADRGQRREPGGELSHRSRARCARSSSSIVSHHRAGGRAGHRVAAERRGVVAGREASRRSSATRSAPIGRPFASPLASATASGLTPSCSWAKKVPVRPTPHCTSSKQEDRAVCRRELGGRLEEPRGRGVDAALALDRLDEDAADLAVGTGGRERLGVVQPREAHVRHERPEPRLLRRLAGDRQRAERAAVERVLEGDDARLAARLARVLQPRLDRLRTGVAEERLRAAEPRGEPLGELEHRLGPVEVRGVPEAVELGVRRRERPPGGSGRARRRRSRPGSRGSGLPSASSSQAPSPRVKVTSCRAYVGRILRRRRRPSRRSPPSRRSRRACRAVRPRTAAWSLGTIPPWNAPRSSSRSASSALDRGDDVSVDAAHPAHLSRRGSALPRGRRRGLPRPHRR